MLGADGLSILDDIAFSAKSPSVMASASDRLFLNGSKGVGHGRARTTRERMSCTLAILLTLGLAACGGGGDSPLTEALAAPQAEQPSIRDVDTVADGLSLQPTEDVQVAVRNAADIDSDQQVPDPDPAPGVPTSQVDQEPTAGNAVVPAPASAAAPAGQVTVTIPSVPNRVAAPEPTIPPTVAIVPAEPVAKAPVEPAPSEAPTQAPATAGGGVATAGAAETLPVAGTTLPVPSQATAPASAPAATAAAPVVPTAVTASGAAPTDEGTVPSAAEPLTIAGAGVGSSGAPAGTAGSSAGRKIYVLPASTGASDGNPGTQASPLKTISAAMRILKAGDEVLVGPGVYRETVVVPDLSGASVPTTIRGLQPGKAIIKGSDLVTGWVQAGSDMWFVNWSADEPEQVYRAGTPLQQIGGTVFGGYPGKPGHELASMHRSEGGVWPGRVAGSVSTMPEDSFFFDTTARRLYVRSSKPLVGGEALEVSVRTYVLQALAAHLLTISDLDFEHSNTSFKVRHGAIMVKGSYNTVRGIHVRRMDAFCAMLSGEGNRLQDSLFEYCGQAGINVGGSGPQVIGNTIRYANTRKFNKNWEAGGAKFTGTPALVDAVVARNLVVFSTGDGLWFDWTPQRILIEANVTAYNTGHGIHFEASTQGTIVGNTSYGNGLRGIYLLESSYSEVRRNIVFANGMEGIAIASGTRIAANPRLAPVGNRIYGNTIAWNDPRRLRMQLMLPEAQYGGQSDKNVLHATDVLPRYAAGWVTETNPYQKSLPAWRAFSGQDQGSVESNGAVPPDLAAALASKTLLERSQLPAMLQTAGVP